MHKYKQTLSFMLLALMVVTTVASPMIATFGATTLSIFSIVEFYLMDLVVSPPLNEWSRVKKDILSDFKSYLYGEYIAPIYNSQTITFKKIITLLPFIAVLIMMPLRLFFIPFNIVYFAIATPTILGILFTVSCLANKPLYRFIRLEPLLHSIIFSVITDLAAVNIITAPLFGALLYAVSLIPLYYFFSRIEPSSESISLSSIKQLSSQIDSLSILFHLVEAGVITVGAILNAQPLMRFGMKLSSHYIQVPLLALTTTLSTTGIFEAIALNSDSGTGSKVLVQ